MLKSIKISLVAAMLILGGAFGWAAKVERLSTSKWATRLASIASMYPTT